MKVTTWSPDTCKCVIEYKWDDTISAEERVHTYSNTVETCADHTSLSKSALYDTVSSENTMKNKIGGWIIENLPSVTRIRTDEETGETQKVLKPKIKYDWSFDGEGTNRVLKVKLLGVQLDETEKTSIRDFVNARFGTDKVVVI